MKKGFIGIAILLTSFLLVGLYFYQNTFQIPVLNKEIAESYVAQQEKLSDELQPVYTSDMIAYALQNDEVQITFDGGANWSLVPIDQEQIFSGEYNGNKREMIEDSYILTDDLVLFLTITDVGDGAVTVSVTYSLDQGKTWEESVISEGFPMVRFRKINFVTDDFGYVVLTGGRTMSQEGTRVFLTTDRGSTWIEAAEVERTTMLADGAFIDGETGFLSFGTISPVEPTLVMTDDAGETWTEAVIDVPAKYEEIFLIAEMPTKMDDHLEVLINQGPSGDYLGGRVKGEFISTDGGHSWTFSKEVEPDEET